MLAETTLEISIGICKQIFIDDMISDPHKVNIRVSGLKQSEGALSPIG